MITIKKEKDGVTLEITEDTTMLEVIGGIDLLMGVSKEHNLIKNIDKFLLELKKTYEKDNGGNDEN